MLQKYLKMAKKYTYQCTDNDHLLEATYPHQSGRTCKKCDHAKVVDRNRRPDTDPQIHYGTIGSSNTVIKDSATRDRLRKLYWASFSKDHVWTQQPAPCLFLFLPIQ